MLNHLLKRETAAIESAKLQLHSSRQQLTDAKDALIETTEACLIKPATLAGIFAGGVASDVLVGSSKKSINSGLLSTIKLSFITQVLNALSDADHTSEMQTGKL